MFKKSLTYVVGRAAAKMHYARWLDVYAVCSTYEPERFAEQEKRTRIPVKLRWEVWRRDNFMCHYCHMYGHDLTLDHVVPHSKGGEDTKENLITCCSSCNNRKGKKSYETFVNGKWLEKKRKQSPYPLLWTTDGPVMPKMNISPHTMSKLTGER